MKVIWSPLAEGLISATRRLEKFPKRGRPVPEVGSPEFREILHGKYRIIYKIESEEVLIVTIRHGARSLNLKELGQ